MSWTSMPSVMSAAIVKQPCHIVAKHKLLALLTNTATCGFDIASANKPKQEPIKFEFNVKGPDVVILGSHHKGLPKLLS